MHQREASGKLLFFLFITAVLRVIFVLFLAFFSRFDFPWVHNFPPHAFALPSLCESCETRKFRCTVENGEDKDDILAKCSSSVSLRARRSLRIGFDVPDLFARALCLFGETASRVADVDLVFLTGTGDCGVGSLAVGFG